MSPLNTELVLTERKTTTIRPLSYLGRFSKGDEVQLGKTERKVRIVEIRELGLSDVDKEILKSEGNYSTRKELLRALRRFYPGLTNRSRVLLIRFRLL